MGKGLAVILCLLFGVATLRAQGLPERAKRYFEQAMRHEAKKKHQQAREAMEQAIAAYPAYTDALSILGAWYFQDHQFEASAAVFRKALGAVPNGGKLYGYPLARSLTFAARTDEALQVISRWGSNNAEWERLRAQALFIQKTMRTPWGDTARNMGPAINTRDAEMFPWISTDEETIYFTRRINNSDEDFYKAVRDTCEGWYTANNMGSPPNTLNQEAAQMISADGHYLFFMECENRSINGWGQGGCDLYMSYTADSIWSAPQSFGATINTPGFEGMPCLSPDNRELYFVSDRAGGFGGLDIWVSRFEDGLWRQPRNLGPEVNTPADETAPYLHIDNSTLYFASTGHTGMGGADLFLSRRSGDTTWTQAQNLGYPFNTTADESSLRVNVAGNRAYFSSDRDRVAGNFDIYEMDLPKPLQPVPVQVVKGYVYDSLTGARLNYASIYVRDALTGDLMYHFKSNRGDGSFMITLPEGVRYHWHTDRISYQDGDDTLYLAAGDSALYRPYPIALLPADYIAPVSDSLILTIHFPRNATRLTDTDRYLLYSALEPWLDHREALRVFVNSYTDNSGTPLINEQISYTRAHTVAGEIRTLGVPELNIQAQGWGEADPVDTNDTGEGQDRNRRVEIIIRR